MDESRKSLPQIAGSILLLAIANWVAYSNSFSGEMIFDDKPAIMDNPSIRSLSLTEVLSPPHNGAPVEARPLLNLSFALNYAIGGLSVRGYHVVNLAIHVIAGAALFGIVRRTLSLPSFSGRFQSSAVGIALATSLIWTLHPLQTESVTYISQRAESLMGQFYLLTLYCSIRSATAERPVPWSLAAIASCAAGMASKEVMVSAPLMVVLYDRVFLFPSFAAALKCRKRLYSGLAASWLLLVALVVPSATRSGSAGWGEGISTWHYLLTQAAAVWRYLWLCVWPHQLVLDYGTEVVRNPIQVLPQMVGICLLLGASVWSWRWFPWIGLLATWFVATLAPTSSVVPIVTQTMAEHRMYLPLAPLVILFTLIAFLAAKRYLDPRSATRGFAFVIAAIALGLAARTHVRNQDYESHYSIWGANLRHWPQNNRPRLGIAERLMQDGQVQAAIEVYSESLKWQPNDPDIYNARGVAWQRIGQFEPAVRDHTAAIERKPDEMAYNNRARAYRQLGNYPQALADYTAALGIKPDFAEAYYARGLVHRLTGQLAAARSDLKRALELNPSMPEAHHDLAVLDQTESRWDAALEGYSRAARLAPENPLPWINRGVLLQQLGRYESALPDYDRALALDPRDAQTLLSRAAIHLALAHLDQAVADVVAARQLGASPSADFLAQLQSAIKSRDSQTIPARDPLPKQ